MTAKNREGKKGYVLVTLVFVLVALLGFAALAVDVGILYGAHTSAQRAADAAALAGAYTFISSPSAPDPVGLATARAMDTATENQILTEAVQSGEVAIDVDYPNRMVTVDITHPVNTFFAKALFISLANVHAQGIAEAAPEATGSKCVKPWFIPNNILTGAPACGPSGACIDQASQEANLVILSPDNTINTPLVSAYRGHEFTIKPGNPSQALSPGLFFAIEVIGTGGSLYEDAIRACPEDATMYCYDEYTVEPGNMIGPTAHGVDYMIAHLPNGDSVDPDTWHGIDPITDVPLFNVGGGSVLSDTSHQLVVAPIWDVCTTLSCLPGEENKLSGGQVRIPIVGFALLFIEGMSGNDVIAHLLDVQACGANPPITTETGPFGVPLRLVRKN